MKLRPFELTVIIIFAVTMVISLFYVKFYKPNPKPSEGGLGQVGPVVIWGTLPDEGISSLLRKFTQEDESYKNVSYKYFKPEEFDQKLLVALADGEGPDMILVSQEKLVAMRKRIAPIDYKYFPKRNIRDLYVDGAAIFALSDGVYGYPLVLDPLVMYWNRTILANHNYLSAPATWEELVNDMFPNLIKRTFDRTITRSVVAMGEYDNINNAFGIISLLTLQTGSQLVRDAGNGRYINKLNVTADGKPALVPALDFYTRFSKSSNSLYSWNGSFVLDRERFVTGDLVFYFGFGSEARRLEKINPNFDFDIAEVPQGEGASVRRTYGKIYALSVLRTANNPGGAARVATNLTRPEKMSQIASVYNMAPALRSLVAKGSNDIYGRVIYGSANIAYGWLNPGRQAADRIISGAVSDINENRNSVSGAVSEMISGLNNSY